MSETPPASHQYQSSSSKRVDVPRVPSRSAASRSKPPTPHLRSIPSPVTAQRHAEFTSASRSGRSRPAIPPPPPAPPRVPVPRTAPPQNGTNKGILSSVSKLFARRQRRVVSEASLTGCFGRSDTLPEVPETPDPIAAVLAWRDGEVGNKKIRRARPGVTFEFADLGSEPHTSANLENTTPYTSDPSEQPSTGLG